MISLNVGTRTGRLLEPSVYRLLHQEKKSRMVLVHVGYLVLPVFGSVRNRGIYI